VLPSGDVVPIDRFARDASKASGRKSHCKGCDSAKSKAYYAANRAARLAYMARRSAARKADPDWRPQRRRWSLKRGAA